jgi:hypothetical protein
MPAIPIQLTQHSSSQSKLVMLEYQGKIETCLPDTHSAVFGTIDYHECSMTIGSHKIKGRRVKLANPVAVVVPNRESNSLDILHVITEKILFDGRPMTIFK